MLAIELVIAFLVIVFVGGVIFGKFFREKGNNE